MSQEKQDPEMIQKQKNITWLAHSEREEREQNRGEKKEKKRGQRRREKKD